MDGNHHYCYLIVPLMAMGYSYRIKLHWVPLQLDLVHFMCII